MAIAIILIAVLVVLLASATFVAVTRRRGRGPELEPPPRLAATGAGTARKPDETLPPERLAEIEEALRGVEAPTAPPDEAPGATAPPPAVGEEAAPEEVSEEAPEEVEAPVRPRFRDRLGKARSLFSGYLGSVRDRGKINAETWDDLEEALILADVGVETTTAVLDRLRGEVKRSGITDPDELLNALKDDLVAQLEGDRHLEFESGTPNVWLFVGVNGVGKTTTIGKIGMRAAAEGRTVVMAAGDTFRAAAADQLELWARRVGADLVRGAEGGDPAAIVFDAKERAAARHTDLVLADTAGRLHTKVNLMEELKKVRRVADRPPGKVTEVLLVIDATTGQNGLIQAKEFTAAVGITGVVLTKLDGTAKGGIALAIQTELGIPIKLVGLGEGPEDLVEFDAKEFIDALFS
ncbi:MAG TPA: signal recognition particle-docking protein FtsY [Acidimicrobiales bacterium]|jgi:fused signal recognition particle receptor